jgi:hypothetical protein
VPPIHIRAIAVSLFAFFVLPYLIYAGAWGVLEALVGETAQPMLFEAGVLLMWAWFLAPLGAGYLVAKLARGMPLWHGLLVGVLAAFLQGIFFRSDIWWVWVGLVAIAISCALFGAWLWRYRHTGTA